MEEREENICSFDSPFGEALTGTFVPSPPLGLQGLLGERWGLFSTASLRLKLNRAIFYILVFMTATSGIFAAEKAAASKPLLLHNLSSAAGATNNAHPWSTALAKLTNDFEIRPLPEAIDRPALTNAALVWLVYPAPNQLKGNEQASSEAAKTLLEHTRNGGGLLVMTLQSESKKHPVGSQILKNFTILQNEHRTGAKTLKIPATHPVIGGLAWNTPGFYPMDVEESPALESAVLVPNDLSQKTSAPGSPDFAGMAMIWGRVGQGRAAIIGDSEWSKNSTIEKGDNQEIMQRLALWAAGLEESVKSKTRGE